MIEGKLRAGSRLLWRADANSHEIIGDSSSLISEPHERVVRGDRREIEISEWLRRGPKI